MLQEPSVETPRVFFIFAYSFTLGENILAVATYLYEAYWH